MKIKLPDEVKTVIKKLNENGYKAYVVGGFVRDSLRNVAPHDCDVTTSAKPDEVLETFKNYHTIETGLKHGTVTVRINHISIEITTFRIETTYSDNRHPDKVEFTSSIEKDLSRRDLTINAMAYNEIDGLVDVFGGREDIKNKIVRCVNDADTRFNEDALRILRALRFSSELSFDIEKKTSEAILKNKNLLKNISSERIFQELARILCGENVKAVLIKYYTVIDVIIPEFSKMCGFNQNNQYHCYDILNHTINAVAYSKNRADIRFAALLHDIGKLYTYSEDENGVGHFFNHAEKSYDISKTVLNNLKVSNDFKSSVLTMVKYHGVEVLPTKKSVKRLLNKIGEENFLNLLEIKRADVLAQAEFCQNERLAEIDKLQNIFLEIKRDNECFSIQKLAVNGNDLIKSGITDGKEIGTILKKLFEKVLNDECENKKEMLLKIAVELKKDF